MSLLYDTPEVIQLARYLRGGGVAGVGCGLTPPSTVEHPSPSSTVPDDSAPRE